MVIPNNRNAQPVKHHSTWRRWQITHLIHNELFATTKWRSQTKYRNFSVNTILWKKVEESHDVWKILCGLTMTLTQKWRTLECHQS